MNMGKLNELLGGLTAVFPQIAGEQRIVLDRKLEGMLGVTEAEVPLLAHAIQLWDREQAELGMPICGCLVHSSDSILPGCEFTEFATGLGIRGADRPSVIWAMRQTAWAFWGGVLERDRTTH